MRDISFIEELLKSDEEDDQQKREWEAEESKLAQPKGNAYGKRPATDGEGDSNKKRRCGKEEEEKMRSRRREGGGKG